MKTMTELEIRRSEMHHWNKYHNADSTTAFMGGEFYLGELCINCKFGNSDRAKIAASPVSKEASEGQE
jgi:hypothetical protein